MEAESGDEEEKKMCNKENVLIQFTEKAKRKKEKTRNSSHIQHKRLNSSLVAVYCLFLFHLLN